MLRSVTEGMSLQNQHTEREEIDFLATVPESYSLYADSESWSKTGFHRGRVTTWPGTPVGKIIEVGYPTQGGLFGWGSWKRYVRVRLFNGAEYGGWMTSGKQFINLHKLTTEKNPGLQFPDPRALDCGCIPHDVRPNDRFGGVYCHTEGQGYCNFECPHEDEEEDRELEEISS